MNSRKEQIRATASAWRTQLPDSEWVRKSRLVCTKLMELDQLRSAARVHSFWPIHAKKEVDIRPVLRALHASNLHVFLPVLQNEVMHSRRFTGDENLLLGRYGVLEPALDTLLGEADPIFEPTDVILVPALAADLSGNRIGYGKGYYDRFLQSCPALKIVPLFANQVVTGIPAELHDVTVDILVSDEAIHYAHK